MNNTALPRRAANGRAMLFGLAVGTLALTTAGSARCGRKVRAPQGRVVGNAHRPRGQGKCHRERTARHAG